MEIQPKLIRDERMNQVKALVEYGYNNSTALKKELYTHILAQDHCIKELLTFRKSLYQLATKILKVSLGQIYRDSADMVEKTIMEKLNNGKGN